MQTELTFRQLDTSTRHTVQTSVSYHWMAGSAQPSAVPHFWCCFSLDRTARTPRLDRSVLHETLVGTRLHVGMGVRLFLSGLIQVIPQKWISILCIHDKDPGALSLAGFEAVREKRRQLVQAQKAMLGKVVPKCCVKYLRHCRPGKKIRRSKGAKAARLRHPPPLPSSGVNGVGGAAVWYLPETSECPCPAHPRWMPELPWPGWRQTIVRVDSFCQQTERLLPGKCILHRQNHFCGFRVFQDGTVCVQTDCRCHTGSFMAIEAFNPFDYDSAFQILPIKEAAPDPNPRDAAGGSVPVSFVSACTGKPICTIDKAPDASIMSLKH